MKRRTASVLAALPLLLAGCGLPFSHGPGGGGAAKAPKTSGAPVSKAKPVHYDTSVLTGDVLIADSKNSRLLLVSPSKQILWQYPAKGQAPDPHFKQEDDAFFSPDYQSIITNQEDYGYISILDVKTGKMVWSYGQFGHQGDGPGQLHNPDDAIMLKDGNIVLADIINQRILWINPKTNQIVRQLGKTRVYSHNPPKTFAAPNGAFPGPSGSTLVTEIQGYVDLISAQGKLLWSHKVTPWIPYPSDANFTPSGNIIVVSYEPVGAIAIFSPKGGAPLWYYKVKSGPGKLNHPSLAVQMSNGNVLLNDDHNDRVIVINPQTKKIIWQYGKTGVPGKAAGMLNVPDGLDILPFGQYFAGIHGKAGAQNG